MPGLIRRAHRGRSRAHQRDPLLGEGERPARSQPRDRTTMYTWFDREPGHLAVGGGRQGAGLLRRRHARRHDLGAVHRSRRTRAAASAARCSPRRSTCCARPAIATGSLTTAARQPRRPLLSARRLEGDRHQRARRADLPRRALKTRTLRRCRLRFTCSWHRSCFPQPRYDARDCAKGHIRHRRESSLVRRRVSCFAILPTPNVGPFLDRL